MTLVGCLAGVAIALFFASCDDDFQGPDPVDVTANYSNYSANDGSYLNLTYNGKTMTGKSVDFSTVKGETADLTLYDIIPGEKAITIRSVPLSGDAEGYSFSGSGTGESTSGTFNYEGRAVKGKLTLTLSDVKMGNAELWTDTYTLASVERGSKEVIGRENGTYVWMTSSNQLVKAACYAYAELEPSEFGYNAQTQLNLLQSVLGYIVPQLLQDITVEADGTFTVSYSSDAMNMKSIVGVILSGLQQSQLDAVLADRTYKPVQSTDLVYWYPKDGQLMLKLDLVNIIARIVGNNGGQQISKEIINDLVEAVTQMDALKVKGLLATLNETINNEILGVVVNVNDDSFQAIFKWLSEGIPMRFETKDGRTRIYVDRETLVPLFKMIPEILPLLEDALPNAGAGMGMIKSMLTSLSEMLLNVPTCHLGLEFDNTNN